MRTPFFAWRLSGDNVLKFDDDATANEEVEVTFTVTEGGIYFFKNTGITFTDGRSWFWLEILGVP